MPARPNSRQASASRICEGSLYIDLRLRQVIPARLSAPPGASSRSIFHDLFGVRRVLLPLLTTEKPGVLNATPSAAGPGMCRSLAGSVRHTSSRAPGGASALRVSTSDGGENPV